MALLSCDFWACVRATDGVDPSSKWHDGEEFAERNRLCQIGSKGDAGRVSGKLYTLTTVKDSCSQSGQK
ncbi:hypothetical protein [Deinococcus humi]|uniref:Uncharacterized protein n=1 Tax=Deinococcus humi TaxID=662880 RepID=A0A7W8JVR8_9DEIO|nr:hypothetical protein [Deinococcus humi]MBB5363880.1 hypothetical protein [Deinococcus humi]